MQARRSKDVRVCEATFRVREDFGKDVDALPEDIKVALRRALINFQIQNPDYGVELETDLQYLKVLRETAIGFPWIVRVTTVFARARGH